MILAVRDGNHAARPMNRAHHPARFPRATATDPASTRPISAIRVRSIDRSGQPQEEKVMSKESIAYLEQQAVRRLRELESEKARTLAQIAALSCDLATRASRKLAEVSK